MTKLKCAVKIDWIAPKTDGGSSVLNYRIEIGTAPTAGGDLKVKNYKFVVHENCGKNPDNLNCIITMHSLSEAPFNLRHGDTIVSRVSSSNVNGFSMPSTDSIDKIKFIGLPKVMSAPSYSDELPD